MMRRAKRSRGDDAAAVAEQSGDAVDFGDFERLIVAHRRKDRGQTPRQHRLAATGRPDQQQIVAAGRRDFERTFGLPLSAHVRKIAVRIGFGVKLRRGLAMAKLRSVTLHDRDGVEQRIECVQIQPLNERGFVHVCARDE